jgi:hypothetical protein
VASVETLADELGVAAVELRVEEEAGRLEDEAGRVDELLLLDEPQVPKEAWHPVPQ